MTASPTARTTAPPFRTPTSETRTTTARATPVRPTTCRPRSRRRRAPLRAATVQGHGHNSPVPRRVALLAAATLALAAPAHAGLRSGDRATIDVSVATLWKAPKLYRAIDRPSLGNPVDPVAWS